MQIDYLEIGGRIRAERTKQGISQEKLAEMVDVGTTHISHIETRNTIPSLKTLVAIINALNLSADELLRGHLRKAKHVFEGEIAEILKDCSEEEVRIAADMVKALISSLRHNSEK